MTDEAARLAYVAVSRAMESLIIVAPGGAVSPWL
jgi:superfamily I DNA/RNA helicase